MNAFGVNNSGQIATVVNAKTVAIEQEVIKLRPRVVY
jgi:hypothetical protein